MKDSEELAMTGARVVIGLEINSLINMSREEVIEYATKEFQSIDGCKGLKFIPETIKFYVHTIHRETNELSLVVNGSVTDNDEQKNTPQVQYEEDERENP